MAPGETISLSKQNGCNCIFLRQRWYHGFLSSTNVWMKARGDPSVNTTAYANMRWIIDELKRVPDRGQPYMMLDLDQRLH
eukprot:12145689-Karenia_brevis.AAC.1